MKFLIDENKIQPLQFMRSLGYHPHKEKDSFARRLSRGEFPRFHVYLKKIKGNWEISLHLDQKGACHSGQKAHSGEYDGELLEIEKTRILREL